MPDAIKRFFLSRSKTGVAAQDPASNLYGYLTGEITVLNNNIDPAAREFNDPTPPSPTFFYELGAETNEGIFIKYNVVSVSAEVTTWAKGIGGTGTDYCLGVRADAAGNVFVTGTFSNTIDFGGGVILTSAGGYDVFVAKYSSGGLLVWAKRFGGVSSESVKALALDPSGNIFVSGVLSGGSLIKLDSSGNLLWTKMPAFGFPNNVTAVSCDTDSLGNVVVTGSFNSMYPGVDFGDSHLLYSQSNSTDNYLAKYSPTGVCLWAYRFVNSGDTEYPTGVLVDKITNKIYLTGYTFSGIDLGGGMMGNGDYGAYGYIGVFDTDGGFLLQRQYGTKASGAGTGPYCRSTSIALDSAGNIIVTASYVGPVDLGGGNVTGQGMCVVKFQKSNLAYVGAALIGGDVSGIAAVDAQNNIYICGSFTRSVTFGTKVIAATGGFDHDMFVAKYTPTLSYTLTPLWVNRFGSNATDSSDSATALTVDSQGFPIVAGSFQDTANFGNVPLTSVGGLDGLLMKLNPTTGLIP